MHVLLTLDISHSNNSKNLHPWRTHPWRTHPWSSFKYLLNVHKVSIIKFWRWPREPPKVTFPWSLSPSQCIMWHQRFCAEQTNASFPFWICHMSPMTRQTCSMLGCSWARTWNQNHTSGKALLVLLHLQCCLSSPFITFDNYQGQRGTLPARETAVLRLLAFSFLFLFRQAQSFLSGLYSEHGARSLCLSKVKGFIGFAVFLERGGKGVAFVISHNSLSFCGTTRVMAPISSRVQYYHSISYPPSHPSPTPPPALSLSQHREDNITPPTSQPPPPPNCAVRQGRGVSREGGWGWGRGMVCKVGKTHCRPVCYVSVSPPSLASPLRQGQFTPSILWASSWEAVLRVSQKQGDWLGSKCLTAVWK